MESSFSRKQKVVCAVCCHPLEHSPISYCPQHHPCCQNCFKKLSIRGTDVQCPLCRRPDHLTKRNGRPYRHNMNVLPIATKYNYSKNCQDFYTPSTSALHADDEEKMFEILIGLSKEQFYQTESLHVEKKVIKPKSKLSLPSIALSKRPLRCPHKPCHKTVAVAQFVNHFKSEHKDVPICTLERNKELLLPFDITLIEHDYHLCLAMITVYEINRINYLNSSETIAARTCNKFCQKVPISTFWLMVSGSPERTTYNAYCLFWLFTDSEETFRSTIELSSREDSVSLSTYCEVSNVLDKEFINVKNKLQCLIVTKPSFRSILKEGTVLNLRVTIH